MNGLNPLLLAFIVGGGFGWSLERAGLANPQKLAGQFYLTDFTVLKVMMTAIVTCMLGAFWLGRLGLVNLSHFYVPETFILPQVAGGLIFGVGFVLSGLCPGTSCVAAASGKGDGLATVGGLLAGVLLTGLAMPLIQPLYVATPLGSFTLPQLLHLPYGVVVAGVTVMAILVFQGVGRLEHRS